MSAKRDSGGGGTGLYVYGVVHAGAAGELTTPHGVPVRLVEGDGVAAVVSEVALDDFGEETLAGRIEQPGWLEERVRVHDRVLEEFLEGDAVVPFRFGSIYGGEDAVRSMLAQHGEALAAALARVAGRREWGVKVFVETSVLRQGHADADAPTGAEAGSGRAYFDAKRRERTAAEEARAQARVIAGAAHERLAGFAEAAADLPSRSDAPALALNGAYLVARAREDAFTGAVAELAREHDGRGVRLELTGPWPPYSFVDDERQ